ncbi:MAG: class II aldolase/adducin family protein [Deltaproteobacteria bacterium]|nr:class II aldolase/adducin family protein [Deltaproteobacteria bacterium]MBI3060770.1 class II aldolase/adducin family protein [Deltaproteobacteria bacterium]
MANLKRRGRIVAALKKDLIAACRILSAEQLVQGFGHVSARLPDSDLFLLTPRVGLALVRERDLIVLNLDGEVIEGKLPSPFEAPLHTAIFNGRAAVRAIARIHARRANYFSVTDRRLEPVHNHGSFFTGGVPVFKKTDLISTRQLGEEVAAALGKRAAVLLRGNGQVTVGRSIPEAVMMAIYLEEAADILYGALQIGTPVPLTADESALRQEQALPPVDLERAWNFFKQKRERR